MNKGTFYIDTLGCPKNVNDSEAGIASLVEAGYERTDDPSTADFLLVNTCAFIEDAKRESIDHIFSVWKKKKAEARLIVTGCLAQRYAWELNTELPEAAAFIGVNEQERWGTILDNLKRGICHDRIYVDSPVGKQLKSFRRGLEDRPYTSTIKIAEGCDKKCSYCAIPLIRGPYRSKREEDILREATELAQAGCRELTLIAEDTSLYGVDLYGKKALPDLLRKVCRIEGFVWIRLLYCYDDGVTEELADTIASEDKICKYIDMPLQHGSDQILRAMNRRSTSLSIRRTVEMLRQRVPGIRIRTTFLVGFPGETEDDYGKLMDLVADLRFDRLGVFAYSKEEGTKAASFKDQVPKQQKEARLDGIMMRQMAISREKNKEMIGHTYRVIVDQQNEDGTYTGRTQYDAPEIDNAVIFTSRRSLEPGDFAHVLIEDAFDYDIIGSDTGKAGEA